MPHKHTLSQDRPQRMVILGATSEIAQATIIEFAKQGEYSFHLAGRNLSKLAVQAATLAHQTQLPVTFSYYDSTQDAVAQARFWQRLLPPALQQSTDLTVAGNATSEELSFDAESEACREVVWLVQPYADAVRVAPAFVQDVDVVLCAVGYLGPQLEAQQNAAVGELILESNFTGLVRVLAPIANYFSTRKAGKLIVISSVAGERGRCSNYYYGAAKAGLTAYLSGLRVRLTHESHGKVQVLTVLPGYVLTKMVAGRKLPPYISAQPEVVARDIVRAAKRGRSVLYTMWLWRYIMGVTKLIPEVIFKHLHRF